MNNTGFLILMNPKIFLLKTSIFRRLLLSTIKQLQDNNMNNDIKGCTAGSKYLADLFNVSEYKIKREIGICNKNVFIKPYIKRQRQNDGSYIQSRQMFIQNEIINNNSNDVYSELNKNTNNGFWLSKELYDFGNCSGWTLLEACILQQIVTYSINGSAQGCGYNKSELAKLFGSTKKSTSPAINKLVDNKFIKEIDKKYWSTDDLLEKVRKVLLRESPKSAFERKPKVRKVCFNSPKSVFPQSEKCSPINKDINKDINKGKISKEEKKSNSIEEKLIRKKKTIITLPLETSFYNSSLEISSKIIGFNFNKKINCDNDKCVNGKILGEKTMICPLC
ncbi:hypothetical protein LCGC14_2029390, partial [marine sediment metagenome]